MAKKTPIKKESINPFKMRGAWMGAAISFCLLVLTFIISFIWKDSRSVIVSLALLVMIFAISIFNLFFGGLLGCPVRDWGLWHAPQCSNTVYFIGVPLFFAVIGFLIGWCVHLFIKKIRGKSVSKRQGQ